MSFTIGATGTYDRLVGEQPVWKTGKDGLVGYPGGWIWETVQGARTHAEYLTMETGTTYAVYELELPKSWGECVYRGDDGLLHLLVDAQILRKVPNGYNARGEEERAQGFHADSGKDDADGSRPGARRAQGA